MVAASSTFNIAQHPRGSLTILGDMTDQCFHFLLKQAQYLQNKALCVSNSQFAPPPSSAVTSHTMASLGQPNKFGIGAVGEKVVEAFAIAVRCVTK